MKKIAVVYPSRSGATVYFRLDLPFRRFKNYEVVEYSLPKAEELKSFNPVAFMESIKEEIVLFHRINYPNMYLIDHLKRIHKKKIIFDTDDLEYALPSSHPLKANFPSKILLDYLDIILRRADEVWVTTKYLRYKLGKHSIDKIKVIPNALDLTEKQWIKKIKKDNEIPVIGWAGGTSHLDDLSYCAKGLEKLVKDHIRFKLKICGIPLVQKNLSILNGKHVFTTKREGDLYQDDVKKIFKFMPDEDLQLEFALPLSEYASFYDDMDIVLAPLASNNFNDSKSELKILEAGAKSTPIVCSSSKTYYQFSQNYNDSIFIANSASSWYSILKKLIENTDLRVKMGLNLNKIIRNYYDLEYWAQYRENRIKKLLEI